MPTVIPVKFSFASHDLWFDPKDTGATAGEHLICTTERGTEIGLATSDPFEVPTEELDGRELKPVVRIATNEDLEHAEQCAQKGEDALPIFRRLVEESELDMKPVGVEYLFGGEKAVCYFSAEDRIDFRQLVRDLGRELHERIDMRQIGVREEAACVGGFAHCGQELCCTRFGRQFEPVSIRMAKEQDLPLNSTKISGACGRLMCCLRYEFEAYRDFKNRAPKRNAVITTPFGMAKIVEYDTPKEQLGLRLENGKTIYVPLSDMESSPEACKKSEELGCALRPDTVSREALERLNSPEVQMALAEIDREFADGADDTFDEDDIFVMTPVRDRQSSHEESYASLDSSDKTPRRRRQRQKTEQVASSSAEISFDEQTTRRTQRDTTGNDTYEQKPRVRRRRHHTTQEESSVEERFTQQNTLSAQQTTTRQSKASPESISQKRTRRPGDRAGSQQSAAADTQTPRTKRTRSQRDTAKQTQDSSSEGAQQAGSAHERRARRTHRTNNND